MDAQNAAVIWEGDAQNGKDLGMPKTLSAAERELHARDVGNHMNVDDRGCLVIYKTIPEISVGNFR